MSQECSLYGTRLERLWMSNKSCFTSCFFTKKYIALVYRSFRHRGKIQQTELPVDHRNHKSIFYKISAQAWRLTSATTSMACGSVLILCGCGFKAHLTQLARVIHSATEDTEETSLVFALDSLSLLDECCMHFTEVTVAAVFFTTNHQVSSGFFHHKKPNLPNA